MQVTKYFSQPKWVLITASQNHSNGEPSCKLNTRDKIIRKVCCVKGLMKREASELNKKEIRFLLLLNKLFPQSLILSRLINDINPNLLRPQKGRCCALIVNTIDKVINGNKKIAILITGSLRTVNRAKQFLSNLPSSIDVFICTDSISFNDALCITDKVVIDDFESKIHGAANQWHKLKKGLEFIQYHEQSKNKSYTHIYKIRTDFYFNKPICASIHISNGSDFVAISDKVFGGKRETIMLFKSFLDFSNLFSKGTHFIDSDWISQASDSVKWYGFLLERDQSKGTNSVQQLKQKIIKHTSGHSLRNKLKMQIYRTTNDARHRFFEGSNIFASEILFAAFLMHHRIIPKYSESLSGFLFSDRGK